MKDALQCPSLFKAYENYFRIGAAVNGRMPADPAYDALICRHFSSITADNQMKPMFVMDHKATLAGGDPLHAAVRFDWVDSLLSYAREKASLCGIIRLPGITRRRAGFSRKTGATRKTRSLLQRKPCLPAWKTISWTS